MRLTINKNPKPLKHWRWKVLYLMCIWIGLNIGMSSQAQTTECHHNRSSLGYYETMRVLPVQILSLHGTEIDAEASDAEEVVFCTFNTSEQTQFYEQKGNGLTKPLSQKDLKTRSIWRIYYCAHCRLVFQMNRVRE